MDDTAQAYFGYIMMPAFVILVLSNFIYQPVVRDFGVLWTEGKTGEFSLKCAKMCFAIGGITALVLRVSLPHNKLGYIPAVHRLAHS